MAIDPSTMGREKKTVEVMIRLYCKDHYEGQKALCEECNELYEYAKMRLDMCPFQENKPSCNNCPVHCYQPQMRERVKEVMRYSGLRMVFRHPISAVHHAIVGLKKTMTVAKKSSAPP